MEIYRETIGKQSTLVLSTDSGLYKFMKSSDPQATGDDQREQPRPMVIPPAGE